MHMMENKEIKGSKRQIWQTRVFEEKLSDEEKGFFRSPARKRFYEKRSLIDGFESTERCETVFIVVQGSVDMMLTNVEGRRVCFLKLGRGEGNFLFQGIELSGDVCIECVAEKGTELWFYPWNVEKCDEHVVETTFIQQHEGCRAVVGRLLDLIADIAFFSLKERLIKQLKLYAQGGNGEIAITHETLASDLGSSREVISRLLKQLEDAGMIALGRKKIVLLEGLSNQGIGFD